MVNVVPREGPRPKPSGPAAPRAFGLGTSLGTTFTMIPPRLFQIMSQCMKEMCAVYKSRLFTVQVYYDSCTSQYQESVPGVLLTQLPAPASLSYCCCHWVYFMCQRCQYTKFQGSVYLLSVSCLQHTIYSAQHAVCSI